MKRRRFLKATLGMALVVGVPLNIPVQDDWYEGKLCATNWPGAEYDKYVIRVLEGGLRVLRKYDGVPLFGRLAATEGAPTGESIEVTIGQKGG